MKEFDKHMTEPHEKWPSGILRDKPELIIQFHQLIDETNQMSDFFNAFTRDQINNTIISRDKRDYLGETLTTIIIISLGMLEHMGCNFEKIFDEKIQRLEGLYQTDEAKKLIKDYGKKLKKQSNILFSPTTSEPPGTRTLKPSP